MCALVVRVDPWRAALVCLLIPAGCTAILGVDQDYSVGGNPAAGAATSSGGGAAGLGGSGPSGGGGMAGDGGSGGGAAGHSTGGDAGSGGTPTGTGVGGSGVPGTIEVRVANGGDDVEECIVTGEHCSEPGAIYDYSTDLELVDDPTWAGPQVVAIRFQSVGIPQGAVVTNAYLEFVCDETTSIATELVLQAEASDNAPPFTLSIADVTNRTRTTASVAWSPVQWVADSAYQTPSLVSVVQEVVDRAGFGPSSAMVFIVTGSGSRVAQAYEGDAQGAPLLHVDYLH